MSAWRACTGGDGAPECAGARVARARDGLLRDRVGAVRRGLDAGSVALPGRRRARWLGDPITTDLPTKSAISQARTRLGDAPVAALYREVVAPIATVGTPGASYRGWRVMSLDGTTLDVGDTAENAPVRLVGLLENGTHVLTSSPHERAIRPLRHGRAHVGARRCTD